MHSYMHIEENIDQDAFIICDYRVTTDLPMNVAAESIAAEQSTGTWTNASAITDDIFDKYSARVLKISDKNIRIAYPVDNFSLDVDAVPQILSVIAGNLFDLESISKIRLEDVFFPKCVLKEFNGPKFGINGMRKALDRPKKPLIGTIVKPKIGLSPKKFADYIFEAGMGGITNGKDSEILSNQKFCPIEDRTIAVAEALDKLKTEGHLMIHAINVSTSGDKIIEIAEKVQSWGAKELMVDVTSCGFAAVQSLVEDPSIKIPIHVRRTMHGAITRDPFHGISMLPISKIVRMCGGDTLYVGTLRMGKMYESIEDRRLLDACIDNITVPYKEIMPVCSGGIYPDMISNIIAESGFNVQIQANESVADHPEGIRKGAIAICQAVDAACKNIDIKEYAGDHEELRMALEK
ncbi:MAG: RuBisCO large subunit C-terminal-like domain-containing protein [archaeon]|nr:RuBisCO large subunit C-terminal-like domain-containing protein [archaeon]